MIRALSAVSRGTEKNSSVYRVYTVWPCMRNPCHKLRPMMVFQGKQVARRDWLRWSAALPFALVFAGCGSPRLKPSLSGQPDEPDAAQRTQDESPAPPRAQAVAIHAMGLVGTPYRYGGNTPDAGFDCSGLIGYVFHHAAGVRAPRTVVDISGWGAPVERAAARSGDLAVFSSEGAHQPCRHLHRERAVCPCAVNRRHRQAGPPGSRLLGVAGAPIQACGVEKMPPDSG
jgi:hypothetical protein